MANNLPTAIPVPASAVVVVMDYQSAEQIYEYILAHPTLPDVFKKLACALDHPEE